MVTTKNTRRMLAIVWVALSLIPLQGCFDFDWDDRSFCCKRTLVYEQPVYLSYEALRQSVKHLPPAQIQESGKLFVTEQYLYINDINRGIHVINNTDPAQPTKVAFISIPGNLDILVKGNILYADSYIDLLAIDLSTPEAYSVIHRIEDVFPYDPYQSIGRGISLGAVDKEKGVVVASTTQSNR